MHELVLSKAGEDSVTTEQTEVKDLVFEHFVLYMFSLNSENLPCLIWVQNIATVKLQL